MKYIIARKLFSATLSGFYSDVSATGLNTLPSNQPVLFISNHCNAFIDPLLLASQLDRKVTFTAKNTLAKNPLLKLIIKSFSVELFSRRMDRSDNASGRTFNEEALQRLQNKLLNRGAVYIFPEGQSHNDIALRDFKTGAAKLALSYAQSGTSLDKSNDLLIVPLGLSYSDKSTFRSTANIQIGEPLSLRTWLRKYPDAPASVLTKHFKTMVEDALVTQEMLVRQKQLSVQAPLLESSLSDRFRRWEKRIIGIPLGVVGWLINALPFATSAFIVRLLSTDHDHPASAAVVVAPPIFALLHAIQLLSIGIFGSLFLALFYLLLLVPSSLFALKLFDSVFKIDKSNILLQQVCNT